ncbi:MAG: DUF5996 family protein [Vicinamibacterales bacterium]
MAWPELALDTWTDTKDTLHLWTQIVGKVRTARTPWINHSWHVTLYVTPRGLTTGPIPYDQRSLELAFDFLAHVLAVRTSDGQVREIRLEPRTVADFHAAVMAALDDLGMPVKIHGRPNEIEQPIPFARDHTHASYDPAAVERFSHVLGHAHRVMQRFRAGFIGKVSPVHFFWGSFDLAVTRFSGRPAPVHPGGVPYLPDWVAREAYSHEVSSAGFWPGGGPHPFPFFYSYAYPEPDGYAGTIALPDGAFYSQDLHEFVLPYDVVRASSTPDEVVLSFLQSTYDAAATLGNWDRRHLDRAEPPGPP